MKLILCQLNVGGWRKEKGLNFTMTFSPFLKNFILRVLNSRCRTWVRCLAVLKHLTIVSSQLTLDLFWQTVKTTEPRYNSPWWRSVGQRDRLTHVAWQTFSPPLQSVPNLRWPPQMVGREDSNCSNTIKCKSACRLLSKDWNINFCMLLFYTAMIWYKLKELQYKKIPSKCDKMLYKLDWPSNRTCMSHAVYSCLQKVSPKTTQV